MNPLVSVIIPTYNRLNFLKEAIHSVLNQTYSKFELIVMDDGSTDNTQEYLCSNNINTIRLNHSGKPGYVRNQGAKKARGKYIAFLDSDDLWKQDKIQKQIDYFNKNRKIVICHTKEIWDRKGKIISQSKQQHKTSGNIFESALKKCIIGPSTVMIEKKTFIDIGMFRESLEIAEDYELWIRITSRYHVGYLDEPLVIKRGGHEDQLSLKYGQVEIFRIKALKMDIEDEFFSTSQMKKAKYELANKCAIYANGAKKRGKHKEASHYGNIAQLYQQKAAL